MQEALTYDDVLLVPQYSDIRSRSEIDLTTMLGCKIPIISSPMDSITESEMAVALGKIGGLGIIHRYNDIEQQVREVRKTKSHFDNVAAAVGISGDYLERSYELIKNGCNILCLDVAHGHHILMREALQALKNHYNDIKIIAGNIATPQGYLDLSEWGADVIRANIGGGCFVPGTLVKTNNGLKPIENIVVGETVYTHTGEEHKVIDTLKFYRNEDIIIINGIECTKNHEYYVVDKDIISRLNDDNLHEYAYWVEAEKLNKEKHMLIEIEQ
jgi:IMP dehydrogenase/GMP reductase